MKPDNQDEVLHLSDLGYKITTERVERMKKTEKAGKLDEQAMRDILEDKDFYKKKYHHAEILLGFQKGEPVTLKVEPRKPLGQEPPQRPPKTR